nr:hypothetical protein [Tanacetum cinerariifolium]
MEDVLPWPSKVNMAFDLRPTEDVLPWPENANMAFDLQPTGDVLPWPDNVNMAFDLLPTGDVLPWPALSKAREDDERHQESRQDWPDQIMLQQVGVIQERQNLEGVNLSNPRSMVVDHDKLCMVSLEGEWPVFRPRVHQAIVNTAFYVPSVFPIDVKDIAKVAFKEPGRFDVNAEITHLMGFGGYWSRRSPVRLVTAKTVKVEPPNPTL